MGERDTHTDDEGERRASVGARVAGDLADEATLLGHFYRGEMDRVTTWRGRLDQTSYWAVTVIAALLTWTFSSTENPHYVLLVGMVITLVFLGIETRRYRGYDIWRSRVRLLEQNLFAELFDPEEGRMTDDWRERVSADLRHPTLNVSLSEGVAHRLRRVYLALLYVLLAAWLFRLFAFGTEGWRSVAAVGPVPAAVVVAAVAALYVALTGLAVWPGTFSTHGELSEAKRSE